jgi:hypothetical protein
MTSGVNPGAFPSEEAEKTSAQELEAIMEKTVTRASDIPKFVSAISQVLDNPGLNFSATDQKIDEIIIERRAAHLLTGGDKYLKDMMDNHRLLWIPYMAARLCITLRLYLIIELLDIAIPMKSLSVYIATNARSITAEDRKMQAIRTAIEGTEYTGKAYLANPLTLYDNHKYFNDDGIVNKIQNQIQITYDTDNRKIQHQFKGTLNEKQTLSRAIISLLDKIKTQLPGSENKSWVKKLIKLEERLKNMECTEIDTV